MKYVIYNKAINKYFPVNRGDQKWEDSIDNAGKFSSVEAAQNHIVKSNHPMFKGFLKDDFEIRPLEEKKQEIVTLTDEEADVAFNNFTAAVDLLNDGMDHIISLIAHYNQELSKCDMMESDILHKIEFENISGFTAVQLCKKLKEIRIKRRECKDRMDFFKRIKDGGGMKLVETINQYSSNLENRSYSVRFLTEIFNGEKVVKKNG